MHTFLKNNFMKASIILDIFDKSYKGYLSDLGLSITVGRNRSLGEILQDLMGKYHYANLLKLLETTRKWHAFLYFNDLKIVSVNVLGFPIDFGVIRTIDL